MQVSATTNAIELELSALGLTRAIGRRDVAKPAPEPKSTR